MKSKKVTKKATKPTAAQAPKKSPKKTIKKSRVKTLAKIAGAKIKKVFKKVATKKAAALKKPDAPVQNSLSPTAQEIMKRVRETLSPTRFSLKDESHLHVGHAGNQSKGGHYSITVVSELFEGLSSLQRNRLVMSLLSDLFPKQIHALKLSLKTESEVPLMEEQAPRPAYGRTREIKDHN